MSRDRGLLAISSNFEPQVAAPFDARSLVDTRAELLSAATWTANDGGLYTYVGMPVVVKADPDPDLNGVYVLMDEDFSQMQHWQKQALDTGASTYIVQDKVYPTEKVYAGATHIVETEAELDAALAAMEAYDIIELGDDIVITSTKVLDKPCKITGGFAIETAGTSADPVNMFSVTSADVFIDQNVTVRHKKTPSTSVESAFTVNTLDFVSKATVEFIEFGYILRGSFRIQGNMNYIGELGNNHRFIAIYNIEKPSIINDVVWNTPDQATARASFIFVSSSVASDVFDSVLKVANTKQQHAARKIRQFFLMESMVKTEGATPSLYFYSNQWNDVNGGIGLVSALDKAPMPFFKNIILLRNQQGDAGAASYKGMMFLDGSTSGAPYDLGHCSIIADQNRHMDDSFLRVDYSSAFPGIAFKNTVFTHEDLIGSPLLQPITSYIGTLNPEEIRPGQAAEYTNLEAMEIEVGGLPAGSVFPGLDMAEMWDKLLYPELFPTLADPSATFCAFVSGVPVAQLQEIGAQIPSIMFDSAFDQGSISPDYGTFGLRSGLPSRYEFTGTGLTSVNKDDLTDSQEVTNYVVLPDLQEWSVTIDHDEGEQPVSNKGNDYSTPLAANTVGPLVVSFTGVMPTFATTASIDSMTKQALVEHDAAVVVTMAAEDGVNKQAMMFPELEWSEITALEQWNEFAGRWDAIDLAGTFAVDTVQQDINGTMVDYRRYTHTGPRIGTRQLRWSV